jgi:hypothetical protein
MELVNYSSIHALVGTRHIVSHVYQDKEKRVILSYHTQEKPFSNDNNN